MKPVISVALFLILSTTIACSGVQHQMPETGPAAEKAALAEIRSQSLPTTEMAPETARGLLFEVTEQIKPAAYDVCTFVHENRQCAWQVVYSPSGEINAVAMPGNLVVVTHGMIETMESADELAFVVGHEISHHIADHLSETRSQVTMGAIIGAAAMAAITSSMAACTTYACQQGVLETSNLSVALGGQLGGHVYSKKQEKEADYLSTYMLNLAGYDLDRARFALVKIGVLTGKEETSVSDTHPAGPERLASYDGLTPIVLNDQDGFPGSDDPEQDEATVARQDSADENKRKCRLYLPEDDICIH